MSYVRNLSAEQAPPVVSLCPPCGDDEAWINGEDKNPILRTCSLGNLRRCKIPQPPNDLSFMDATTLAGNG